MKVAFDHRRGGLPQAPGGGAGTCRRTCTPSPPTVRHGTTAITAVTAQNSTTGVSAWATDRPGARRGPGRRGRLGRAGRGGEDRHAGDRGGRARRCCPGDHARRARTASWSDPVMVARSGDRLVDGSAQRAYVGRALPLAALPHPQRRGRPRPSFGRPVRDTGVRHAPRRAGPPTGWDRPPRSVKGGGVAEGEEVVDVLFDGKVAVELRAPRVDTRNAPRNGLDPLRRAGGGRAWRSATPLPEAAPRRQGLPPPRRCAPRTPWDGGGAASAAPPRSPCAPGSAALAGYGLAASRSSSPLAVSSAPGQPLPRRVLFLHREEHERERGRARGPPRAATARSTPTSPLAAEWHMLAEDGHREGLNFSWEELLAYGFSVDPAECGRRVRGRPRRPRRTARWGPRCGTAARRPR